MINSEGVLVALGHSMFFCPFLSSTFAYVSESHEIINMKTLIIKHFFSPGKPVNQWDSSQFSIINPPHTHHTHTHPVALEY